MNTEIPRFEKDAVRLWRDETDYDIFPVARLADIPNGFAGVGVLVRKSEILGRVVVFIFSFPPAAPPALVINCLLCRRDLDYYSINEIAVRLFENEETAVTEKMRLQHFYRPMVPAF